MRWSGREMGIEDYPVVVSTWLRSYKAYWPVRSYFVTQGEERLHEGYYWSHKPNVRLVLEGSMVGMVRGGERVRCVVAYDVGEPGLVLGWVCWEGELLHYVYVKKLARGLGVGRWLMGQAGRVRRCSHMTSEGAGIAKAMGLRYGPWWFWHPKAGESRVE